MNKYCRNCDKHNETQYAECCKWCIRSVIVPGSTQLLCSLKGHSVIGCDNCPDFIHRFERGNYIGIVHSK